MTTRAWRQRLLVASALGEIVVGLALAAWPAPVMGLLLGTPVAGSGVIASRMGGIAVAAMGAAWWTARHDLDGVRVSRLAPSFLGYNLGVSLLFVLHALSADRTLPIAWGVAAAHLGIASGFALALLVGSRRSR